jgi:potassium efflux system protein
LPALAVLERVELTDATRGADGAVLVEPLTLWSIVLVILAGVLTVVTARNLPAVLELAVLQRFPIDGGTRYAIITLVRYVVIALGLVWVSRLIGIEWGRAQWIVAALGVGLGFGLQEIVANFVSGLIILFERPIRIGDVVTVGEVSGTVSRLQIRATTITDWDNKEILVPNKAFITDRVINWTLSNPVTRLLIPVGVAYGSDVGKAHQAISDAVQSVPAVLDDPSPSVLFIGFGESSLDFEIRAFVGQLANRLPTLHELNKAIEAGLRDAGIEIPFPQRDVWLRRTAEDPLKIGTITDREVN